MKLFINTGGKGKRLYPLVKDIPKPMINICGKPVLYYLVKWADKNGVKEIVMMNGYKSEKIIEYFEDGSKFNVKIIHSNEPYPLGSGGALKFAKKYVDDRFVYISGDLVCDIDLIKMNEFHEKNKSQFTVLVHKSSHPYDSDILDIEDNFRVKRFISKNENHINAGDLSNSGLCIIEPKIIELMEKEIFNFENDLYPVILKKNLRFFAYSTDEFIADMGTFERLKKCKKFLKNKLQYSNKF